MKKIKGNLWDYLDKDKFFICITTNGTLKNNGEAVMGRGCAKEAADRFPALPKILGRSIRRNGNKCSYLAGGIISFPVKHNWHEAADLDLIKQSAKSLARKARTASDFIIILPRPGCGNGRLSWEDVKKVIKPILPDNVWVITNE